MKLLNKNSLATRPSDRQSESSSLVVSQPLSPGVLQKTMLVRQRYGERDEFLQKMNPSVQVYAGRHPERAFFGDAPTLAIMRQTYGDGFPATWLLPQILDLVVYSNSRGTLNEQQQEFLAETIANEYYFLKASELQLFFYRFKSGRYGHFYGSVDPMRITMALEEFVKERNREIAKHESEERDRAWEEHMKEAISPADYCRQRGYPEMNDILDVIQYEMQHEAKVKSPSD